VGTWKYSSWHKSQQFLRYFVNLADLKLTWKFARSGGKGGQNVNKRDTKALLLVKVADIEDKFGAEFKDRLVSKYKNLVTRNTTDFVVTSERHRTQEENRRSCAHKLRAYLEEVDCLTKGLPTKKEKLAITLRRRKRKARGRALRKSLEKGAIISNQPKTDP